MYVRYVQFSKLSLNDSTLLPVVKRLSAKGSTGKNLGKLHLESPVLNRSEHDKMEMVVGVTNYRTNKNHNTSPCILHRPFILLRKLRVWGYTRCRWRMLPGSTPSHTSFR